MTKFLIRPAQESDEAAIYALLDHETPMMEEGYPYHPSKVTPLIMGAIHNPASKERCWIAEADGKPVGLIRTENLGSGVFVEEDYRGYGIGPALIKTRENFLKDHGKTNFLLDVSANNTVAIKTYKKLGYEFDEASRLEFDRFVHAPDKNNIPVLKMSKNLT